jgi:pSer/pThr/pTyr-binding forkhead associated (FHA) protein
MAHIFRLYEQGRETVRKEISDSVSMIKVGRDVKSHIQVNSEAASRLHLVLEDNKNGTFTLVDLGNEPGTKVNGARVNKCKISEGDEIQVGDSRIVYEGYLEDIPKIPEAKEVPEFKGAKDLIDSLMPKSKKDYENRIEAAKEKLEGVQEALSKMAANAVAQIKKLDDDIKAHIIMRLPAETGWKYAVAEAAEDILDPKSRKITIKEVRWWAMLGPMEWPKDMTWRLTCMPVDPHTNQVVSISQFKGIFGPSISAEDAKKSIEDRIEAAFKEGRKQLDALEEEVGDEAEDVLRSFLDKFQQEFAQD